jgi:hypothetical protein
MINEAKKWIGYLEHWTNNDLECFTSNMGKGGCTIFSLIICRHYPKKNFSGLPWCVVFIYAVCIGAFGKDRARAILGKPCAGSRLLARRMKRKGLLKSLDYIPTRDDLVFFHNGDGKISHCGIVECVKDDFVITIEGNTVDPNGFFEKKQGGAVARRRRKLDDNSIVCYASLSELI